MKLLKNRTVLGVLCILLSLLICFGVAPMFNRAASKKTEIVRVAREIKAGDEITADMLQTAEVGNYGLPDEVLRETDLAVGKYAAADLLPGDYVLRGKLLEKPIAQNAYLNRLDGTKQAISVTIKTFAAGLSGKLQSGDIVTVIAPDYKKQGITAIPPELQYVEVIGVTAESGMDADTQEQPADSTERELPATVTVLASPLQSQILADLDATGQLHMALVYRGSPENAAKFTDAQDQVIEALLAEQAEETEDAGQDHAAQPPAESGALE